MNFMGKGVDVVSIWTLARLRLRALERTHPVCLLYGHPRSELSFPPSLMHMIMKPKHSPVVLMMTLPPAPNDRIPEGRRFTDLGPVLPLLASKADSSSRHLDTTRV